MAEARHGIRITEPLNHFMRKVFDSGRGLSDDGLATLADSVRAIDNVVSHINESTAFFCRATLAGGAFARARSGTRCAARPGGQRYQRLGARSAITEFRRGGGRRCPIPVCRPDPGRRACIACRACIGCRACTTSRVGPVHGPRRFGRVRCRPGPLGRLEPGSRGIRSRDRQHLQRGGDRAAGGGARLR